MISRHNGADKLVACLDIITKIAEQIAVLGVMGSTPATLGIDIGFWIGMGVVGFITFIGCAVAWLLPPKK